jgi:cytochrome c556
MKLIVFILTLMSTVTLAHDGATGIVAERMDAMSAIGDANKALSNISRGRADFDLQTVVDSAKSIEQHSGTWLLDLFPEGRLDAESDAKAAIWQDWETFSNLTMDLQTSASALGKITEESEFSAAYKNVSSTCGSCHKKFRAKR